MNFVEFLRISFFHRTPLVAAPVTFENENVKCLICNLDYQKKEKIMIEKIMIKKMLSTNGKLIIVLSSFIGKFCNKIMD